MPLYEVLHAIPLNDSQKDSLASAITYLHSTKFTTPKNFVNVSFIDVAQACTYVGGKRATGNHIRGHVRSGPSRTQEDWNELCQDIDKAWNGVVTPKGQQNGHVPVAETELRSVIIIGGIIAGLEAGFLLPSAGQDVNWLQDNWAGFEAKAKAGDQEFVDMVADVKQRGLLDGTNGMKTAQQRLEEMLGWGDAA